MPPNSSPSALLPLIYTVFLLWLEPIAAILGTVQTIFSPQNFLRIITPAAADIQGSPTPVETLLLVQLGSMYLHFAFIGAVVLRYLLSRRLDSWRLVVIAQTLSDVGHLYGLWLVARLLKAEAVFWNPMEWRIEDVVNIGFTWFGLVLRIALLMGIGVQSDRRQLGQAR